MNSSQKRSGEVLIEEWDGEEPFFDTEFAKARSKGQAQVGVAQPRRILSSKDANRVHSSPSSSNAVLAAYENGVVISGLRGSASLTAVAWFGLLPAFCMMLIGLYFAYTLVRIGASVVQEPVLAIGLVSLMLLFFLIGLSAFSVLFRGLVLMPSDFPVIFNKESRDVWVAIPKMPSFIRIFELHPVRFERYSWDSLRPRTYRIFEVTPGVSSARWTYILTLVFGQEDDMRKVACEMNIGSKGWGDDFELLQLWEHVRQYMNGERPAVDRGEKFKTFGSRRLPKFPDEAMASLGRKLSESEAWAAPKG